jgi:hypothetical protein
MPTETNEPIEAPRAARTQKPGLETTEFWISILTAVSTLCGQLVGVIPEPWGVIMAGIAAAAYTISRGLTKSGGQ